MYGVRVDKSHTGHNITTKEYMLNSTIDEVDLWRDIKVVSLKYYS